MPDPANKATRIMPPYQRLLADPGYVGRSEDYGEPNPVAAMQLARLKLEGSMPTESAALLKLEPMDRVDRFLSPEAIAITTSPGRIAYNPERLPADMGQMGDVLAHELAHIGQQRKQGFVAAPLRYAVDSFTYPYHKRPYEREAFEVEARRRDKRRDISLDPETAKYDAILSQLGAREVILPQYADDALDDDVEREPVRYLPPDGGAWPPVPKWDRRLWSCWLAQHDDWTPERITQYLDIDRYKYGLGLQRHAKEPYTYFYLPVPAAVPMHASKVPNLCYGGAVGGTKSHSTRFDAYRHLLSIPDYNAILMRRTHEELKRNHTNPALKDCAAINDFFQQDVMDLVPSEHEMRFPLTRGLLTFGHCQNLGDEEKYLGPEYDEFRPDEMATFEKQQIIGVAGRLRSVKHGDYGQVAARLIGTTNPGPSWIRQMFIDKSVPRHENPRYKPDHYLYIPAKLYDNPYLMDEDGSYTTYEDRLYAYSPQRRKQLLDGNWDAVTGQFFPEWSKDLHVGVCPIPTGCKIECAVDWGYSPHPGVCLWIASLPNGRLYVFAEWVFNGEGKPLMVAARVAARISEMTRAIVKETKGRWNKTVADPSMWAKDGHSGESYEETFRRNGVRMIKADNDRVQGWGRLRHWLQRHPEGGSWLLVDPDCAYTLRTLPTLVHDKNDPDDCDTHGEDHAADAVRYMCMARPSPTKYKYRPLPSIPDNIAAMIGQVNQSNVRPFGRLR